MKPNNFNVNFINKKLSLFQAKKLHIPVLKKSAILIPIYAKSKSFQIIMTARSKKLNHHKGEMSFPGGKFDPNIDDTLKNTALRETYEEIGIPSNKIKIIGTLDDFPTFTRYIIRPFIGIIQNPEEIEFKINPNEVSNLVKIPIDYLIQKNLFTEIPFSNRSGKIFTVLSFNFEDPEIKQTFTIWGASAHILARFLKRIYNIEVTNKMYFRPTFAEIKEFISSKWKKKND